MTTSSDIAASSSKFLASRAADHERWLAEMNAKCEKRRFTNERLARNRMHDIQAEATEARVPVRAYLCPNCFGWHLTSMPLDSNLKVWRSK